MRHLIIKNIAIGIFSGLVYTSIEWIYRGRSAPSMFFLAFIVGLILSYINNEIFEFDDPYEHQVIFGTIVCVVFEYLFGMIFNQDFTIWDYRRSWGTIHALGDQVNLAFIGAWFLIVLFGLPLLDFLQWKLGIAPEPYYTFLITGKRRYYIFKKKGE